jgi:hypothetical protein
MKRILLFIMLSACFINACEFHHVKGNGNLTTEDHPIGPAERIHIDGGFDVELTQGPTASLKIEIDDNLREYVVVEEHDGRLRIGFKDGVSISNSNGMTLYITVPRLEEFKLSGSGKVTGKNRFTEGDHLDLSLSGSGEIDMEVNTPDLEADISGSGNITLRGETKDQNVNVSGSGNYQAEELKSENAKVSIAGSGNSRVFADGTLDVNIAGSGSVYYKGSATISRNIVGSGGVSKVNE